MRIRSTAASLLASSLLVLAPTLSADSTPQTLPFSQDWSNTGLITANDNWSAVPGIEGFLGQDIITTTGGNPQLLTGTSAFANDLDIIANQATPNTNNSGGAAEFDGIANAAVALQGSGTADAPFLLFHLDTRGRTGITVAYSLRDIDGSADNAVQPVALQYRVGNSGAFTNVPAGFVADASSGPSLATLVTAVSALLPAAADDQALVQVRVITANAVGNDEWIGVDDISITASTVTPALSINDVSVTEGNTGTSTATFTVSLSQPAPTGGIGFDIATADGTATTAGNDYVALSLTGQSIAAGASSATFAVTVSGDTDVEANETFVVNVTNVANATVADGQAQGTITNDDAAASPNLSINDVSLLEGNAGTTTARFTVSLATPAPAGGVSFDIATADGSAAAGSDYVARTLTAQTIAAGTSSFDFDVAVNGDSDFEADESFAVNVSNVTGATVIDGGATGTIRNDDVALVAVHAVQGAGSQSPRVGEDVNVEGIVTARRSNGFYLQTPDSEADADPLTSQGLFVFTSSAPPAAATIGNRVRVFGRVTEFAFSDTVVRQLPLTQLAGNTAAGVVLTVTEISAGNPLPTPVDLAAGDLAPGNGREAMERFEGMRVRAPSLVTVAPTNANVNEPNATATPGNGVFFATLAGVPRPLREPGLDPDEVVSTTAPSSIPRFDNNSELLRIDSDGQTGAARISVDAGTTISNLVGVIDYAFAYYSLLPDVGQLAADTVTGIPTSGRTPTAVAAGGAEEITVGGFNLLRFFDSINDPGTSEPVLTAAALDRRLGHTAEAICRYVQLPDVLGVVEVENLAVLTQLADRINAFGTAASNGCARNPQYVAYLVEGNDVGGIDVGFLVSTREVRAGVPRVAVAEVTQFGKTTLFTNPDASTELLNDRPPLLLRATFNHVDGGSEPLTILINHMRSLSGVSDTATGSNGWATSGERVRAKRGAQAQYVAQLVHDRQVADPLERIVLLGDFNVFEFNDGLVDGMGILTGRPATAGQALLVLPSPLATPLTVMTPLSPRDEQYSFSFDGNAQSLDHAVVNQRVLDRLSGVRTEHARINADFAETRFGNGPLRTSDHDPVVLYMGVPAFRSVDLGVDAAAVAASIAPGAEAQFTVDVANPGGNASDGASLRLVLDRALPGTSVTAPPGWTCGTVVVGASSTEVTCTATGIAAASTVRFTVGAPTSSGIGAATLGLAATVTGNNSDAVPGNNSDSASVAVVVANRAPVANDDSYSIVAGGVLDVAAPGVLGNDSDPDGNAIEASLLAGPASGTVTLSANGALRYQPNPGFAGSDSFTYRACDPARACATATVRIVVQSPVAAFATRDDRFILAENSAEVRLDVAANDVIDPARRAPGRLTLVQSPLLGTAALDDGGTPADASDDRIRYRPNPDRSGVDLMSYSLCEGGLGSRCSEGMVQIVIRPLTDAQTSLEIAGNGGFRDLPVPTYRAMVDARLAASPLVAARTDDAALSLDPNPEDPWDLRGVAILTGELLPGSEWRVLVDARSIGGGDVDLYVGLDVDGNGVPSRDELRCTAAMSSLMERCELSATPAAGAPARYWVMAHNAGAAAHTARIERFEVPLIAGDGSLVATGPASADRLAAWPLRLGWNDPSLLDGESRVGYVGLRESEGATPAWMPVRLDRRGGEAAPLALASGRPQSLRLSAGERQSRVFIDVPPGQRSLALSIDTDRTLDLVVVRSPAPTATAAVPAITPADEANSVLSLELTPGQRRLNLNAPAAGRWSIVLANTAAQPAAVRVQATLTGTGPEVRPGSYFNSARGGHGLFLYPAGSAWTGIWYTYRQDGTSTWYYLQDVAPGGTGVWRSALYRSAWNGTRNTLTEVGSVVLTPTGPDAFVFTHTVDGETGSEPLVAFGRGCPSLGSTPVDASGLWFNPGRAGSGYSVQLFPDTEFHAVFGYDAGGVARFAVAERRGFGGAEATLPLEQIQGFCPLCARSAEPRRSTVGSFRRTVGSAGLARVTLDAAWTNGVPGRWTADEAVQALGSTQGCAVP